MSNAPKTEVFLSPCRVPDAEGIEINNLRLAQSLGLKLGLKFSFLQIKSSPISLFIL